MEIASDEESSDGTVPRVSIFLPDLPIVSGKSGEEILISSDDAEILISSDEVDEELEDAQELPGVVLIRGWVQKGEQVDEESEDALKVPKGTPQGHMEDPRGRTHNEDGVALASWATRKAVADTIIAMPFWGK